LKIIETDWRGRVPKRVNRLFSSYIYHSATSRVKIIKLIVIFENVSLLFLLNQKLIFLNPNIIILKKLFDHRVKYFAQCACATKYFGGKFNFHSIILSHLTYLDL